MSSAEKRDANHGTILKTVSREVLPFGSAFPGIAAEDIALQGYMSKQGGFVKNWKRRYFVLSLKDQRLYYFTDENKKEIKGFIDLPHARVVSSDSKGKFALRGSSHFEVVTAGRTFHIEAPSTALRTAWMEGTSFVLVLVFLSWPPGLTNLSLPPSLPPFLVAIKKVIEGKK